MAREHRGSINNRSRAIVDLVVSILVFAIVALSIPWLNPIIWRGHGIAPFFAACLYQFLIEGVAPLALMLVRGEKFSDYGFVRRGLLRSLALGFVLVALYDASLSVMSGSLDWIPLIRQPETRMALAAGLSFVLFAFPLEALNWGFLEGFFGTSPDTSPSNRRCCPNLPHNVLSRI